MRKKQFFLNLLPVLAITANVLFGCKPDAPVDDPNSTPQDTIPDSLKYNVELEFWGGTQNGVDGWTKLYPDTIQKYIDNVYVDTVYLVLHKGSTFSGLSQSQITTYRNNKLEPLTNISPRVRGKGDFMFGRGRCLEEDSLYFVSKGWTVNQNPR